jgi:outer membrane protein assembly factor BamB
MSGRGRSASRWGRGVAWLVAAVVVAASHFPGAAAATRSSPALLLSPATAVPTQTIKSKGRGFTPSALITVDLDGTVLGTVTSSQTGRFVISVAVPSTTLPGPHTVTATDSAGVVATAALTVSTPWAGFRFDTSGTGANPYENVITAENASTLYQAGGLDFAGNPTDTPAAAGGVLYFGTDDGVFHAQDLSGVPLWTHPTGGPIESSPALAPGLPTIQAAPGPLPTVFFGSDDGSIYGLDSSSGDQRWAYPTGGPVRSSPVVVQLRESRALILVMFVGSDDGNLYSLDARTGALRWAIPLGAPITSSPAVLKGVTRTGSPDALSDEVVVGTEAGTFAALDAHTGEILWSQDLGAPDHFSSPALVPAADPDPCRAFVGSMDGMVHAFDCATGTPLWTVPTGGPIDGSPAIASCGDGCEEVAIGSEDGSAYAFDPATGDQRWTHALGDPLDASMVAFGDSLGLARTTNADTGSVAVLDMTSGEELADISFPSGPQGPFLDGVPIVVDGAMMPAPSFHFHVRTDWKQSHLDAAHDGFQSFDYLLNQATIGGLKQSWSDGFLSNTLGDPKEAGGQVFVGTNGYLNDFVFALDAKTGVTDWQFADGGEPVYDSGTVYVASRADLYALDPSNGGIKWDAPLPGLAVCCYPPPAVAGGLVFENYAGGLTRQVAAFDAITGQSEWIAPDDPCFFTRTTPTVANGLVYVAGIEGLDGCGQGVTLRVLALDPATGSTVWDYTGDTIEDFCQGPEVVASGGLVYVTWAFNKVYGCDELTTDQAQLIALDSGSGQYTWSRDLDPNYPWSTPPAVAYARVYVGSGNCLYAFAILSGSTLWTNCRAARVSSPAVANGVVYFSDGNEVGQVNAYTGGNLFSVFAMGPGPVSVADGRLLVPTADLPTSSFRVIAFSI